MGHVATDRRGGLRRPVLVLAVAVLLAGCAQKEERLPGVRLDIRTPIGSGAQSGTTPSEPASVPAVRLSPAQNMTDWTHRMSGPDHRARNAVFGAGDSLIWSADIGAGQSRRARITADPVSDGTRIYTIDSAEVLVATTTAGARAWSRSLTPSGEQPGTGGAGLAVSGGTVFATSGLGTLSAVDAATGEIRWTQALGAVPSGPPAVAGGIVYLVTRDNLAWAIDAGSGRVRWQTRAQQVLPGYSAGAGPAVGDRLAIFPFSSGELIAALRVSGVQLWSGAVAGQRIGRVYAAIPDISSDPVIVGDRLYAGTQAGRLVAMELNTGERLWTARTGALGPVLADGNALWVVTDNGKLERLDAATGQKLWSRDLPYGRKGRGRKSRGIYEHFGPILAGGRLVVASSDEKLRFFDPSTGAPLAETDLPGGATAAPIVVQGTLYVVTQKGDLLAFR